jgi:hypothetical protein
LEEIQDYEVSISFYRENIYLSTITDRVGTTIDLENFELLDAETLVQSKVIQGKTAVYILNSMYFSPTLNFQHTLKPRLPVNAGYNKNKIIFFMLQK